MQERECFLKSCSVGWDGGLSLKGKVLFLFFPIPLTPRMFLNQGKMFNDAEETIEPPAVSSSASVTKQAIPSLLLDRV